MLNALEVGEFGQLLGHELGLGAGEVDQLGRQDPLGRARLVGVDVRPVGADDGVVRSGQRSQHGCERNDVRTGAVEGEFDTDVGAEQVAEPGRALGGVVVGAVGERVAVVAALERLEDGRMDAGGVVAGERARRSGWQFHAGQSSRARATASRTALRIDSLFDRNAHNPRYVNLRSDRWTFLLERVKMPLSFPSPLVSPVRWTAKNLRSST